MSQKEFAARMDMSEKHISKLINGEVQLTPETAIRLEMVLGVPAKFWNNLEAIYREKIIRAEAENAMDADAEMAKHFTPFFTRNAGMYSLFRFYSLTLHQYNSKKHATRHCHQRTEDT